VLRFKYSQSVVDLDSAYPHLEIPDSGLFFNSANREIASAIKSLVEKGEEAGMTSVWAKLQNGKVPTSVTHEYLGSMSCALIDPGSYRSTLNLLKENKQRRELLDLSEKLLHQTATTDITDSLQFAMTELARIQGNHRSDLILPAFETACDLDRKDVETPEFVIQGLIRRGQRMMVQTASKAGKSWLGIYRAICIASGTPYLGQDVTKGVVIFINFELPKWHIRNRIRDICCFMKIESPSNLITWNLRGKKFTDISLLADLERQIRSLPQEPIHIEIDPIYKLYQGREENKTEQMAQVLALIEDISEKHNCSIAFNHHHSKGDKSKADMLDRSSGAGVFARDSDVIVDLMKHTEKSCFTVSSILRTERSPDDFVVEWQFPLFVRRADLDPNKIKKRHSNSRSEFTPNVIVDCLSETWTKSSTVLKTAETDYGVKRSTYYKLREKAITDGLIEVHPNTGDLRLYTSPSSSSPSESIQIGESKSVHPYKGRGRTDDIGL
jgi:hypothetical protein